jgi:hypothetical protein
VAFRWGANLPYFGNLNDNQTFFPHAPKRAILRAYSPQEQKKTVLRGFPLLSGISGWETEAEMGLFSFKTQSFISSILL